MKEIGGEGIEAPCDQILFRNQLINQSTKYTLNKLQFKNVTRSPLLNEIFIKPQN